MSQFFTNVSGGGASIYRSLSKYIVGDDIHSDYSDIQSAVDAAVTAGASSSAPANIYLKPKSSGGAYVGDVVLSDGINLIGFGDQTVIDGNITFSTAGKASVSGLYLQNSSGNIIDVGGAFATELSLYSCFLLANAVNSIVFTSSNAASKLDLWNCRGLLDTSGVFFFYMSSVGTLSVTGCHIYSTSAIPGTFIDNGTTYIKDSYLELSLNPDSTANLYVSGTEVRNLASSTAISSASSGTVLGSYTINTNFGSVKLTYSGSRWLIT